MQLILDFAFVDHLPVNLQGFYPELLFSLSERELAGRKLLAGNRVICLGDICRIQRVFSEEDRVIIRGETSNLINIGRGMSSGKLTIEGNAGDWAGTGMLGGELTICGNASRFLGAGMAGGFIRVLQDAGSSAGAEVPGSRKGMNGGTILVGGSAGREAGAGMLRGLLVIAKDAGEMAGVDMHAGSIFIFGRAGIAPGMNLKRGSLVIGSLPEGKLPGFRHSGYAETTWLRLYFRHLNKLGMALSADWINGRWNRYTGDYIFNGKGEIHVFTQPE